MKKNAMLKIAAVLLVAVLLTTCAISSTFAKYVSTADDYEATARVAKWGIKSTTTRAGNLFDKSYVTTDGQVVFDGTGDTKLLAPGTSGSITITNKLEGTAEVSGIVDYTATADGATGCVASDDLLARINLKVTTQKGAGSATTVDVDDINDLVEAINGCDRTFDANEDLDENIVITISWNWALGNSNDADNADNAADTALAGADDVVLAIRYTCDIYQTGPAGAADGN